MATQPTETTKPRVRTVNDELTVIAQRAQAFTNASGTAIALSEGSADEIICRARSGSAAPDVGAALRVNGTFTGLCIQSGKELRCDDAETDTRVDTAAIRSLGIRSMVVTPIREDNRVVGVLACFAPTAHAFTITHVAVLKTMADQISVLLLKERRGKDEGSPSEGSTAIAKPAVSAPLPAPVVIKPAAAASAAAAAPARVPAAKVEPIKSEVATPVPFPKRDDKLKPEVKASFGTLDSVAAEHKSGNSKMLVGAAAVLIVAVSGGVFLMKSRKPAPAVPVPQVQETSPSTTPAAPQPATNSVQTSAVVPAAPVTKPEPAPTHAGNSTSTKNLIAADTSKKPERTQVASNQAKTPALSEKPAEKPTQPTTIAVAPSGPSRLSAASTATTQTVEISPTLSMTTPSAALSNLTRPASLSAPAVAQSELEPMKVLRTVQPIYPAIARVRRLSGSVIVQVTVGKDGKVHNPQFVSGQPVFRDAAFDAVKQWQFKPATLNGQPIDQATQIKMDFKP